MKAVLITFMSVVLLVLAFFVLRGFVAGAHYVYAASLGSPRTGGFDIGNYGPKAQGPYTIHGTVVMDTSQGGAPVPYIQYVNTNNRKATKQLVYLDARACAPGAGDFPCVPNYSVTDGYPELTNGEAVTATGYLYENRFLVTSISQG